MASPTAQHLIDVRTPGEFSTGPLYNAINIEYQLIDQLSSIIPTVQKSDAITLYCRSGRRSAIALQMLKDLGYENVRDIGGLEEARAVLKREEALREIGVNEKGGVVKEVDAGKKEAREKSLGALLNGLRGLE
ncbi:uncharacterized protein BDR25DRAFT_305869 [Lindgomyces ingoldianus]|uniref:Uncharacterized protein n=1 Tax=Lindgomyces ingoldianus TaxID=673940 RepID=A0ACB6QJB2_9PLEO|nr:uncharacterized protein BDR25DRAFT_305869 [Lindgomyces ingoldianus]KAF2467083.1 hypothetical protein BDR25DRAFT_305869 [Lindgomyces ingoldianus]